MKSARHTVHLPILCNQLLAFTQCNSETLSQIRMYVYHRDFWLSRYTIGYVTPLLMAAVFTGALSKLMAVSGMFFNA